MHLQQHRALQRREPIPPRQPAFILCTWVNHREKCLALFSSRGQNTLKKKKQKTNGIMTNWLFTHVEMEAQRSMAQPRSSLAGQRSWEEPGTDPNHCSVLSHPAAQAWTEQEGCKSVDSHLRLSFLFSPWSKQKEQTPIWSTGKLFMGNMNNSFAISLVNKTWRWFLELQYPHIWHHRVPVVILQNSKNN